MRILIYGAGAVGCYFGAFLARAGHEVVFVARGEHAANLARLGLTVETPRGVIRLPSVTVVTDGQGDLPQADLILLCVKTYDTEPAVRALVRAGQGRAVVITLQNGIDSADRIGALGLEAVSGIAFVSARMAGPGLVRSVGEMSSLVLGPFPAGCEDLQAAFLDGCAAAGLQAEVTGDIRARLWSKFVLLATNAALTCLSRSPAGRVYHDPHLLAAARSAIDEVLSVAAAEGVALDPGLRDQALAQARGFPAEMYASMYHDLVRGKPIEVEALSGSVVRLAERHGIAVPVHALAYACLKPFRDGSGDPASPPQAVAAPPSIGSRAIPGEEWQARLDLACAYRLFDALGWHELIYNHITVRVPGRHDQFLINPFGRMYREITASSLVRIDLDGRILDDGVDAVNPAGFVVHSAVHRARPDAACVMHMHTTAGMAVACQDAGLLPLSFPSLFYAERLGYHEFEGITLDVEECARLAESLGSNRAMILRNHGLLACGPSVADAFAELYHLQRACEVQLAAQSSGAVLRWPSGTAVRKAASQFHGTARQGGQNTLLFEALRRWMDELDPSYRS